MVKNKKDKKIFERTVAKELHDAWKKLKRKRDGELMATELGYSRPVIDRALNYGYVAMPELPDLINKWFMDRLKAERADAKKLTEEAAKLLENNG